MKVALVLIVVAALSALQPLSAKPRILYLYGDVAADGSTPSGEQKPFHQMRLNDSGARGMSQFREAIEAAGFQVDEAYDAEVVIDAALLEPLSVLVLASNQRRFGKAEAVALHKWVEGGGGVIAWSDSAFGGHFRQVGLGNTVGRDSDNDLMTQFGMYFMTDNGGGNYLIVEYAEDHFLNGNDKTGGVRFRGEGVSPVRVSAPARLLAPMQHGGLGGGLRLNKVDGKLDPTRDAALAIAEVGEGRVVGVFDRNLFWNAGEGTRLSHSDNREFTQRLMLWTAGIEDEGKVDRTAATGGGKNDPPQVQVTHSMVELQGEGTGIELVATVTDDDTDQRDPEVSWNVQKGPDGHRFENDNPNGPRIRLLVGQPGTYVIVGTVRDGEYVLRRRLTVDVP
ncbi:MAG: hypothetical protein ACFB20_09105 [Opitutales bacterium]